MGADDQAIPQRESHINLLTDEMKEICEKVEELIAWHKLPFKRFETLRSLKRQEYIFSQGHTKTMNSKHLPGPDGKSRACDYIVFINNNWSWDNKYRFYYNFFGNLVLYTFPNRISWGGSFKGFFDGGHIQLKD